MAQDVGLLIQSRHIFKLDITPGTGTETLERLAKGFSSFEAAMNEETDQTKYLDGGGLGSTTVTGGQVTITFEGHRYFGDKVQDFIFSKFTEVDTNRESTLEWTQPDGTIIKGPVTIATIEGPGGEAGEKGEISVEIHYNGTPTVTPPATTP
ncbi:capsid protein [Bacillus glycinifermentans]|uniref:phage tail tube protein n=1 Tax=Bacillus glycinifermentans TaxID=1664069 RepID=UPI001582D8AD|nr:capsid protein [Bacillus glycinifermentans]NUJ19282.1 capsid protein [Bacillus glycinifermentans]